MWSGVRSDLLGFQESCGGGIERLQPPVVKNEKIGAAEVAQKARVRPSPRAKQVP